MTTEHIKMPAVLPRVRLHANGVQTAFTYPFPIFAEEDLKVYLDGALQSGGFIIEGEGGTAGGTVIFDEPPAEDVIVMLERRVPLERLTDFLEGGDFSARSVNNEFDYLTAEIQQINADQETMLRYSPHEVPGTLTLPDKYVRAGKALAFDGDGNLSVVDHGLTQAAPSFAPSGVGAIVRSSNDKHSDHVSVKDFGAVGDGLADDTTAFINALAAHYNVYVPSGTYLLSAPVEIGYGKVLHGAGQSSVLKGTSQAQDILVVPESYASISALKLEGGNAGVRLYGKNSPCVQNNLSELTIWQSQTGLVLDGYQNPSNPCYWNNFNKILIAQPAINGVHMIRSGGGDTPNANKFVQVRVYSLSADLSGHGFYVESGRYNNAFVDCEANVKGTALACFRIGADTDKNLLTNLYTESYNGVPNVQLDAGSQETAIINLFSASDGAAIYDLSGGNYDTVNAGYPDKNRLRKTRVSDLTVEQMRYDTKYVEAAGASTITMTTDETVQLVSAANGAIEMVLPSALDAVGAQFIIKKIDYTNNFVTIIEDEGDGPDGHDVVLGSQNDYVTVVSNGAGWHITAHNRMAGNSWYHDGTGVFEPDLSRDVYLVSSFGGALEVRLPPANASHAAGRTITVKKVDTSANVVNVSEQGGSGPDGYTQPLNSQYSAITILSDGSQWFILSKFN